MSKVRTRFAPSPTGRMHVGNLRTALYAYLIAKHEDGDFLLRIEDTDQERLVEGAIDIIYRTLEKTGLIHDEGPDKDGGYGPYVQSERNASGLYLKYAKQLVEQGDAYYCFCDKERLESLKSTVAEGGTEIVVYDKHCLHLSKEEVEKNLAEGKPYVIRINMPTEGTTTFHDDIYGDITVPNAELDDMILIKSDGFPTYNFANVIDDHLQEITHVVRGNEYLSSTPKYNLIYDAYGWQRPTYVHVPPVMKDEHHKLSKRNGDASFQDLVAKGYLPDAIMNYIALLGWAPETEQEIYTLDELIKVFNIHRISKSPAIFDIDKLTWMNGVYLRNMDEETYYETVRPYLEKAVHGAYNLKEIAKIIQPRIDILNQIEESVDFFDTLVDYDLEMYRHKKMKTTPEVALKALKASKQTLETFDQWDSMDALHECLLALPKELEMKNGQVLWPIRTAVSGKQFTPGGAIEIAFILGKDETLRRIQVGIDRLSEIVEE